MLKPTLAKVGVFLMLAAIVFLPLFLVGDGPAVFLPVAAIFWLDGLVQTMGAPVAVNGGVDAFNLVPPTALGSMLILLGSAVSLATLYVAAAFLVSVFVFARQQASGDRARP